MPPSVLPRVATPIAGQNRCGFSLMRPNTAGSDPSGTSVADMNETMNSVLRPNFGSASAVASDSINDCNQASMRPIIET